MKVYTIVFLVHVGKVCTYPSLTAKTLLRFVFLKKIFLLGLFVPCFQLQRCCYYFFLRQDFYNHYYLSRQCHSFREISLLGCLWQTSYKVHFVFHVYSISKCKSWAIEPLYVLLQFCMDLIAFFAGFLSYPKTEMLSAVDLN